MTLCRLLFVIRTMCSHAIFHWYFRWRCTLQGFKSKCYDRRMTHGQTICSLGGTANDSFYLISFLQFLLPFSRKRLLLRWIVDIVKEMPLYTMVLMSIQLLQTVCSYLLNYLQRPSNCPNVIRCGRMFCLRL